MALRKLKESLRQKRISQERVAERLGVDRSLISRYLNGKRPVKLQDFEIMANMAGVSLLYLLVEDDSLARICAIAESLPQADRKSLLRFLSPRQLQSTEIS